MKTLRCSYRVDVFAGTTRPVHPLGILKLGEHCSSTSEALKVTTLYLYINDSQTTMALP